MYMTKQEISSTIASLDADQTKDAILVIVNDQNTSILMTVKKNLEFQL